MKKLVLSAALLAASGIIFHRIQEISFRNPYHYSITEYRYKMGFG